MSAPFMQLYVADYLGDTRHLTTEQHGAYLLLLMTMWRSDGVLPDDDKKLARIAGCTPSRWVKIKGDVLEFFAPCEGGLTNARLKFELEKAQEKSIKRAVSGTKGGKAKSRNRQARTVANDSGLLCHSSEPEPDITTVANAPVVSRERASRLPDDWSPEPGDFAMAVEEIGPRQTSAEIDKFRDYWRAVPGAKGRKLDWSATFRNWIRRAAERKPHDRPDRPSKSDHLAAIGRAMADAVGRSDRPGGYSPDPGHGGGMPAIRPAA